MTYKHFENDHSIKIKIEYFTGATEIVSKMTGGATRHYAQKALYDTFGGYKGNHQI